MLSKFVSLGRAMASSVASKPASGGDGDAADGHSRGGGSLITPAEARQVAEVRRTAGGAVSPSDFGADGVEGAWKKRLLDNKLGTLGVGLWVGIVAYFLARVRRRKLPLQMYLIQLRVGAQAVCIGCITVGCFYAALSNQDEPQQMEAAKANKKS